jgi:hypothetical protein
VSRDTVSNTTVNRFVFRLVLPFVMLVALFFTLTTADREQRAWIMQRENAHQKAVTDGDIESTPFVLPFHYDDRIQDAIGLQWPAFALAGIFTSVPRLFYSQRTPIPFTSASYALLALAVSGYWLAIATWADVRLIQRRKPSHPRLIQVALAVLLVISSLSLMLFLGKDLLRGGWPEGPQGAYGVTAWLALICAVLTIEANIFRQRPRSTSEL